MEATPIIWQHLETAAAVIDTGLQALRDQLGEDTYRMTSNAIKAGSTMQVVVALALHGKKSVSLNLVSPAGESVNLGHVEFIDAVALN